MRKGIVLFTTLLLIMALMSVVMIFLNNTKETKDTITEEFALIQTNNLMSNLTEYFGKVSFDEESIFYGSKMPFSLPLDDSLINFNIDSASKYLNINNLTNDMKTKDNIAYDNFVTFLYKYQVRDPEFFINLLIDTVDKDSIDINSGSKSEIVIEKPIFRNGKIYNEKHFKIIKDYYFLQKNDPLIYDVPFDEIFSFSAPSFDINFASKELLKMYFYDANDYSLDQIAKHSEIYEKLSELPFDESYLDEISKKGRFGHTVSVKTEIIKVTMDFDYKTQFSSKVEFLYNTKNKTLTGYTILDIKIKE